MRTVHIIHRLKIGDITHLSDRDSDILINQDRVQLEDLVTVTSPSGRFIAAVVFIDSATVEVEIKKQLEDIADEKPDGNQITVLQAVSNDSKFNLFLEKAVELGVTHIYPIHSELCLFKFKKYQKKEGLWAKIVEDAIVQSRTIGRPILERMQMLTKLRLPDSKNEVRIALSTEPMDTTSIYDHINSENSEKDFVIAVGPEKGWSSNDIAALRNLGFKFVKLEGNILRTETAPLMLISIIKYVQKNI